MKVKMINSVVERMPLLLVLSHSVALGNSIADAMLSVQFLFSSSLQYERNINIHYAGLCHGVIIINSTVILEFLQN